MMMRRPFLVSLTLALMLGPMSSGQADHLVSVLQGRVTGDGGCGRCMCDVRRRVHVCNVPRRVDSIVGYTNLTTRHG